MRKIDITLILAAAAHDPLIKKEPFMPLSLPILASVAPDHNYTLIDMLWEADKVDLATKDEVIGISYRFNAEKTAFYLADEYLKQGKTVILGGAQASVNPYEAKKHASAVVVGEGELLWPMVLKDYENGSLKAYYVCAPQKFDGQGEQFVQLDEMPDLANFPTPKRNLFKRKYTFDITFATRGCPINCDFCLVSDIYGKKLRMKPIDDVVNDIKQFKRFYYLLDDTVFGRANSYDYYLELYEKIAKLPKVNIWTGQANLDAASNEKGREVIKKAAKAGLLYAAVGVESINQDTLQENGAIAKMGIGGNQNPIESLKKNIAFIQNEGIFISGWFAIGYETDTIQTYYDTLQFCLDTHILPIFSPVRALPGSRLKIRMEKEGKLLDITKNVSNISHPNITNTEVIKALTETLVLGYSFKINMKRALFHFKLFRKTDKSLNSVIYKTIFLMVTQKNVRKIIRGEINRLNESIG